jgi:hypothetical protein
MQKVLSICNVIYCLSVVVKADLKIIAVSHKYETPASTLAQQPPPFQLQFQLTSRHGQDQAIRLQVDWGQGTK